jgi:hypothetical protein
LGIGFVPSRCEGRIGEGGRVVKPPHEVRGVVGQSLWKTCKLPCMEKSGEIRLTQGEEEELLAAMDEICRGEFIEGKDLVEELRSPSPVLNVQIRISARASAQIRVAAGARRSRR